MRIFLLGAAVGYVFGAKAGRARYDQIVRTYRKVADHPMVQGAAGVVRAKVGEKVGDKVPLLRGSGSDGHRSESRVTRG
ncbi:hypothetical protein HFP15_13510 [Amycolatopsis sp. K13G38]|uniref:YtxH domain-containing protein n=1 Tax=Amycolatopsis acididurans TaxID=2724524 RepID=A0ABX1J2P2_9PSEU|nr:hypothetical protein [Amycolatopsis acididurans]NKQ53899.1 hypothetical protein [Amycolatopsis acididurans]